MLRMPAMTNQTTGSNALRKVRISANIATQEAEAEITKKDWIYG